MTVDFTFTKSGLEVIFRNTSREVPDDSTYLWDFGDYSGISTEINPSHIYIQSGFYLISLTITPPGEEPVKVSKTLGVSEFAKTQLPDSIYNLIDTFIIYELLPFFTSQNKQLFIEKWQLYLHHLVCSDVPLEEYNNESYYEALENELIMEMAAYDWMVTIIQQLVSALSKMISEGSTTTGGNGEEVELPNDGIKKIISGPSEVEWFDVNLTGDQISSLYKTLTNAMAPGGFIDILKEKLCMLAERICVYLPICEAKPDTIVPKVVNRRRPGKIGGPNPIYPISKGGVRRGKVKSTG